MLRMISPKALIVSNVAHWIFVVVGWTTAFLLYYAGATISSDGASSLTEIFDQMKSSTGLLAATTLVFVIAPIPAGYIAAKIATHARLLNGALSTGAWFMFCVYDAIWGGGGDNTVHLPHWLDVLTTYGIPIPAVLGAYICQMRAGRYAFAAANIQQEAPASAQQQSEVPIPPKPSKQVRARRMTRAGTGFGIFIFLIFQFLLTKHEQLMLVFAMVGALALLVLIGFAAKALKRLRTSA